MEVTQQFFYRAEPTRIEIFYWRAEPSRAEPNAFGKKTFPPRSGEKFLASRAELSYSFCLTGPSRVGLRRFLWRAGSSRIEIFYWRAEPDRENSGSYTPLLRTRRATKRCVLLFASRPLSSFEGLPPSANVHKLVQNRNVFN